MGRLTLNILFSFAQFEREIISERTRDKMAAARKKGKWVGGRVVLGYDLDREQHKLVVNPKEAELVQKIFLLYLEHRSALRVAEILKEQGHRMKAYFSRSGKPLGGVEFHKGHIHNLLNNVVYIGKISYHDQLYQGLHEPIITEEVFQRVQALFAENRKRPLAAKQVTQAGLLSQLLYCKPCRSVMINTYSYDSKDKKKRYKYYVCTSAQKRGYKTCPTRSINADAIDRSVVDCLRQLGQNTELQQQQIEALKSQIQEELARLKEEQQRATETIQQLTSQITVVREQQRMGVVGGPKLEPLTEQLQDAERAAELALLEQYLPQTCYVGEVGLDAGPRFYRSLTLQKEVFEHVLKLCARAGGKVLTVHSVRSATAVLDLIETHLPPPRGRVVLHWFTGSQAEARRAIDLGCYFSINAQMLRSERHRNLVIALPLERLLTETDGPFTQHNGRAARPVDVAATVELLAHAREMSFEAVATALQANRHALLSAT
jgi:Tat protein secretion system quality control protein TatD with DNase activity